MKRSRFLPVILALAALSHGASANELTPEQRRYQHHILAVDEHGSAVEPIVTRTGSAGNWHYTIRQNEIRDEDTRTLAVARKGRKTLYDYLDRMFEEMQARNPREVVIYIHGGLNNIEGAIEKTARIVDDLEASEGERDIYYIGICWNSALFKTFGEHLWSVREGLRQPGRALVSAPAALVADVGSALTRTPLRIIDLLYNDVATTNPNGFARHRAAEFRYNLLESGNDAPRMSRGEDERRPLGKAGDAVAWVATAPIKTAAVPIIDTLGVQPWKNMLRRTRTMFERETGMLPTLTNEELAAEAKSRNLTSRQYYEKITATGRYGATRIFCQKASAYLAGLEAESAGKPPTITLIGHSMGAIVAAEILHRSHSQSSAPLPFDNVVVMAAACSVNDFKDKMVPYLAAPPAAKMMKRHAENTKFYNLCLHDTAERAEKNPGNLDLSPRGSLLVWIDTMYQEPESENDRTLGRWENAILSTDDIPSNVFERTTIKAFGRNRHAGAGPDYTVEKPRGKWQVEPQKHGEFSRQVNGKPDQSFAFWRSLYWKAEEAR